MISHVFQQRVSSRQRNEGKRIFFSDPDLFLCPHSFASLVVLLLTVCFSLSAHAVEVDRNAQFDQANQHYEAEEYEKALKIYQDLSESALAKEVFYNLGNTQFRMGKLGAASLAYRRAVLLDPGMIEAKQNLTLLNRKLGSLQFEITGIEKYVSNLRTSTWKIIALLGVWALIIGVSALLILKPRQPWNGVVLALTICGPIIAILASISVYFMQRGNLDPSQLAIVVGDEVLALSGPFPDAQGVTAIPPGSEVRIRADREKWFFVYIPGESAGWVKNEDIAPLWPYEVQP